jgi:hypothetical protein
LKLIDAWTWEYFFAMPQLCSDICLKKTGRIKSLAY